MTAILLKSKRIALVFSETPIWTVSKDYWIFNSTNLVSISLSYGLFLHSSNMTVISLTASLALDWGPSIFPIFSFFNFYLRVQSDRRSLAIRLGSFTFCYINSDSIIKKVSFTAFLLFVYYCCFSSSSFLFLSFLRFSLLELIFLSFPFFFFLLSFSFHHLFYYHIITQLVSHLVI